MRTSFISSCPCPHPSSSPYPGAPSSGSFSACLIAHTEVSIIQPTYYISTSHQNILTLLPTRPLPLRRLSVAHESELRLKLLHRLRGVVDEREAGALAASILCPEAEAGDLVFGGFVEFAEFLAQLVFAHVRAAGVEDITEGVSC